MRPWLDLHTATVVHEVATQAAITGVHISAARAALGTDVHGPLPSAEYTRFRKGTQRWFCRRLLSKDGFDPATRLRYRLERWKLPGFPGRTARTVHAQLLRLRRMVPPRVRAAVLGLILNRWTTDRRMRGLRGRVGPCVLGCSPTADDAIEHYVHCPILQDWLHRRLHLQVPYPRLQWWLLGWHLTNMELCKQAAAAYVLNKTVHHIRRLRFHKAEDKEEYTRHFMNQQLHEASRGNARLQACITGASPPRRRRRRSRDAVGPPRSRRRLT